MRSIPGIARGTQLAKANALYNITKALTILQQKKVCLYSSREGVGITCLLNRRYCVTCWQTMPLHLLRRAQAIYEGERGVILQLLHQIRKVR